MSPEEKAVIEAAMAGNGIGSVPTTAQGHILRNAVHRLIFACPQCNAGGHTCPGDGNPIGHTQTDCGQHDECRCSRTERVYCHAENCHGGADLCDNCAPLDAGASATRVDGTDERTVCETCGAGRPSPAPQWVSATFLDCLAGDHIRLGQEETDVIRSSSGIWHADASDAWRPRAWQHTELRMELAAVPGFVQYPPNTPVEILMTPDRKAVLTMQSAFPGSAVISSDVD